MTYRRAFQRTIREEGRVFTVLFILACSFLFSLTAAFDMGLRWSLWVGLIVFVFVTLSGLVIGILVEKSMPKDLRRECGKIGVEYTPYDTETGE